MTYVLNNADVLPVPVTATTAGATSDKPGFWQRLYAALIESRRRSALRELRAHAFLVHEAEIVLGGFPATTVSGDAALPFNR